MEVYVVFVTSPASRAATRLPSAVDGSSEFMVSLRCGTCDSKRKRLEGVGLAEGMVGELKVKAVVRDGGSCLMIVPEGAGGRTRFSGASLVRSSPRNSASNRSSRSMTLGNEDRNLAISCAKEFSCSFVAGPVSRIASCDGPTFTELEDVDIEGEVDSVKSRRLCLSNVIRR
jgi:hypothetical protein